MATAQNTSSTSLAGNSSNDSSDSVHNIGNSFYLHPNEKPSSILVSPVLSGPRYHSWARAMRMALISKNKTCFIDKSAIIPARTDLTYSAWERCNMMVLSWLTRSLSPTLAQSILCIDRACDVWENLRARFSQNDIFRLADLQEEIQSLKQGDLSVTDYRNEAEVGDALAEAFKTGLVKREDLSITTKLWNTVVIPKILENDTESVYGPEEDGDALYACMGWPPTNIVFWGGIFLLLTAIAANILPAFIPSVQNQFSVVATVLIASCFICHLIVYRRLTANPHVVGENNNDQELPNIG